MLNGHFENCYGLMRCDLPNIDFSYCNKALIYAPNGVMKSSLSKVFDDISRGVATCDRIFQDAISKYSVSYDTSQYTFNSNGNTVIPTEADRIYVINTFTDSFEFTKNTVSTLLADEAIRNNYDNLMVQFSDKIQQIEDKLRSLTGLTKPKIKGTIIDDLGLDSTSDWTDIFEKINDLIENRQILDCLNYCTYSELFNDKVLKVYSKTEFVDSIEEYIETLNQLLENNLVLSDEFTDRNAEILSKEFAKHNLFNAQHTICLKDGVTVVHSLDEWNTVVNEQLEYIYQTPELSTAFKNLKKLLTANDSVSRLRDIIMEHREIIPALRDIDNLKIQTWLHCFSKLDAPFVDYYNNISQYTTQIRLLYEQAGLQSERWKKVVSEFNRRFRVPFEIQIENKANFLLKNEAPNLTFKYTQGQSVTLNKDDLMISLSTGEKRALYLLYILFDLEKIRQQAQAGEGPFLIIADDIADSFDYKNKYAIIEYLNDLGNSSNIDLLILTHNFDFYRTVKSRLGVKRKNCYIAQRDRDCVISVTEFKYQKDFFKNVIIAGIENGCIDDDNKKKLLISSIPFYRNLCEYSGRDKEYTELTCFLHLKTKPIDTKSVRIAELWKIINPFLNEVPFSGMDGNYYSEIIRIANVCADDDTNEVLLDNKLVLAIAIRLLTEEFIQCTIVENGKECVDADSNQTRTWYEQAKPFLTIEQKNVIENVNLITPESIHLNSFMFEPLIDISNWRLRELFRNVVELKS